MNAQASSADFTIHHVAPDDVEKLVRVHTAAFKTDQFSNLMLLGRDDDAHQKLMRKAIEGWVSAPETRLMKAIDASGCVLGWACWVVKDATGGDGAAVAKAESQSGSSVGKTEAPKESAAKKEREPPKEDPARALGGLMYKERVAMEERYMKGKRYAVLQGLATDPAYQRRGIATKLIRAGLEKVDSEGLTCWIHASPSSHGVYAKAGFEEVGRNEYDLDEWAPDGKGAEDRWGRYIFRHMLRKENPDYLIPV
ncbi:GNAT family [Colletotrichum kahawae]|uniref:GNAT family n=1 Tax=Colletotrichum kahawae TaxID=34407 RepID=A0AAD9Y9T9_COLKA|nr:GNAT family [Colletotrichum kahawae]